MSKKLNKTEMDGVIYVACLTARELRKAVKARIDDGDKVDKFWTDIYESWERTAMRIMEIVQESIIRGDMRDFDAEFIGSVAVQHVKNFSVDSGDLFYRWPWKSQEGEPVSWTQFRKSKKTDDAQREAA